jgi:hypothetical protein
VAIGAVKLQLVTSGRWTVTAEVASSSLVVPAILFSDIEAFQVPPVAHLCSVNKAGKRIIHRFSHIGQNCLRLDVMLVANVLCVAKRLRRGLAAF